MYIFIYLKILSCILKDVFSQLPCYDRVIPEMLANPLEQVY